MRAIELWGVYDRAIPGRERVVLRVHEPLALNAYALIIGISTAEGKAVIPMTDHFMWLGATKIAVPSWVFVYTGSGQTTVSTEISTQQPIHALYWGKPKVVFTETLIIPALFGIGEFEIWQRDRSATEAIPPPAKNYLRDVMMSGILTDDGSQAAPPWWAQLPPLPPPPEKK